MKQLKKECARGGQQRAWKDGGGCSGLCVYAYVCMCVGISVGLERWFLHDELVPPEK